MKPVKRLGLSKNQVFPELPFYEGKWSPIYWEPILLSGERLTVFVAAIGADGHAVVKVILRDDILKVLFPENYSQVSDLLSWASDDLLVHLSEVGSCDSWDAPITGMFVGEEYPALSTDVYGIILQAIPMCSSLGSLKLVEDKIESKLEVLSQDRWSSDIRASVLQSLPRLEPCFNRQYVVSKGARATQIDFMGARLVANFGRIIPNQISRSLKDAKAKILDLAVLRDDKSLIQCDETFRVMVWRPQVEQNYALTEAQGKTINEALLELEGESRALALSMSSYSTAQIAALEICQAEVAL
jgi:hypothetical protein